MNPIIIAVSMHDAKQYELSRGWRNSIIVTPRSKDAARGWAGPVYATPAALDHPDYQQMLEHTAPCALHVDHDRVA